MAQVPARSHRPGGLLNRQRLGASYEARARRWLERKGLRFLAANVHLPGGEIDLIMTQGHTIVFVEVRYRSNSLYGGAVASVTHAKQQKLLRAARSWLARHNGSFDTVDCRFDVLAFTGDEAEWIVDAFTLNR